MCLCKLSGFTNCAEMCSGTAICGSSTFCTCWGLGTAAGGTTSTSSCTCPTSTSGDGWD
jgi:hypothetical protein